MAKVLISLHQPIIAKSLRNLVCYYESLAYELSRYGNEVLIFNVEGFDKKKEEVLLEKIKKFRPDVIFAFNNVIFESVLRNTKCPIALFDADGIDFFYNKELIAKYRDRYYMVTSYPGWENRYSDLGFESNRICGTHPATSVMSEKAHKIQNISFIGGNFSCGNPTLAEAVRNDTSRSVNKALCDFWNNNEYDYETLLARYGVGEHFNYADKNALFDGRIYVLSSILDLGLSLYGVGWERCAETTACLPLASAFDRTPKYSLQHNQDIYNSSKINISISHSQTRGYAFPWRVYDIMASGGMLISSHSELLNQFTKDYVKIPMFKSPYDARDFCKRYLKEENMREDIIAASNEFIEKHGRWDDNFRTLEQFLGVSLLGVHEGDITGLQPSAFCLSPPGALPQAGIARPFGASSTEQALSLLGNPGQQGKFDIIGFYVDPVPKKKKKPSRIKNISSAFALFMDQIPIWENLISERRRERMYHSIMQNRRKV